LASGDCQNGLAAFGNLAHNPRRSGNRSSATEKSFKKDLVMRGSIWVTLVASVVALTGCSEFITTDKPAPTSVVDVVGDPSDPVAESTEQSDILGAEYSATVQIFADSD
jgi:hypothetical protein